MPRRNKGARLYLRARSGREPTWVILDSGKEISTGACDKDIRAAEAALEEYLGSKRHPNFGRGHPASVLIDDVLAEYGDKHAPTPTTRRADLIGIAMDHLLGFFSGRACAAVTSATCAEYVRWRTTQADRRAKRNGRPVKASTARRELVVLSAALRWCWKEGKLDRPIPVALPPQAEPRERHLNRCEAAALLAGALGWDRTGRRHRAKINRHLARFILLAIYTGTRHDAILRLQWVPNLTGGWIDLDSAVLYRRPSEAVDSPKRRPPLPIPPRLMPHLRRWHGLTARYLIEWAGKPISSQERRAWHTARDLAGLGPEVTPHILRHTCATMLLQLGVTVYDVAGVLGTTEDVIRRTYGHHAQDHLRQAVAAFSRRRGPKNSP
jgi:integrase